MACLGLVARLGLAPIMVAAARVVVCLAAMNGVVWAQQQANGTVSEKTVLRGTVVNGVTHQPIGRALVKSTDGRFAAMTNQRGQFEMRFKLKKIDPANGAAPSGPGAGSAWFITGAGAAPISNGAAAGEPAQAQQAQAQQVTVDRPDSLTALRVGFLNPRTFRGDAVPVAQDQEEVTISLTPEAKVVGHVTLADGEAAAGMPLELYRQIVQDGRARWTNVGSAQARSDGEFRFAELEAGIYKLYSAELPDRDPVTSDPRGQGYGYPPDYYPSATDFAAGAVIHLAAGETFQATLTPEKHRYYPIHIGVGTASRGEQLGVEVERDGHPGPGFTLGYDFRDGSVGGMLPDGNYLVKVTTQNANPLTGVVNVSVHGGPASGMVTLLPGTDVDVRVNKEFGSSEEAQNSQITMYTGSAQGTPRVVPIQLQLVPVEEFNPGRQYMAQPPSDPAADGMVVPGVPTGEYRVNSQVPGGYVAAIRCGDRDLQDSTLVIAGGSSLPPIEVTVRNDGAEIDGSIVEMANPNSGSGQTASGYVYIVPARGGGEMKTLVSQPNGDFQIQQLAPGTYRVLAFDRPRNDLEYGDEDAMRKYDAQMVTVVPGQKEKIRVSFSGE
ncbi:MAG TPA: hypothetical protein VMP12_01300 [Candidatus Sulfotelmatobacter sp.]|nr:hypothetical protein [Candidatus Sulfotelmatobacter sp.]